MAKDNDAKGESITQRFGGSWDYYCFKKTGSDKVGRVKRYSDGSANIILRNGHAMGVRANFISFEDAIKLKAESDKDARITMAIEYFGKAPANSGAKIYMVAQDGDDVYLEGPLYGHQQDGTPDREVDLMACLPKFPISNTEALETLAIENIDKISIEPSRDRTIRHGTPLKR